MNMLRKAIVKRLLELRQSQGLSQEELARKCRLDRTYISGIERMTRNLTVDSLEKIIRALDISFEDFFSKL